MPPPLFSVFIVSWNVRDYLRTCLQALAKERSEADFEVIVVDNASLDGSCEMVRREFDWVKLISSARNLGFAAANNLGAQEARGEYYVLLNPDTEINPGFFAEVMNFYRRRPAAAVVGGKIFNPDGTLQPSVRRWPTLLSQILVLSKVAHFFPKLISRYLAVDFNYNEETRVDQVMGACFIVPRVIWRNLGAFDAKFFVWFEEVDFCKRCVMAGGEVWYSPKITLRHQQKASFSQLSVSARQWRFNRSAIYYFYKHYSWPAALLLAIISLPVLLVTYVIQIFTPRQLS